MNSISTQVLVLFSYVKNVNKAHSFRACEQDAIQNGHLFTLKRQQANYKTAYLHIQR